MEKKKKRIFKVASPSARVAALGEEGAFPECLGSGSRRRGCFPRVPGQQLSGKRMSSLSAWAAALGEDGVFPECCTRGRFFLTSKRRRLPPTTSTFPLMLGRLSRKPSPSVRFLALGEDIFPVKRYPGYFSRVLHSVKASPNITGPSPSAFDTRGSHCFP